ncbi:hypothetical protein J5N97_026023 [Dioscorea zingiberensis]|uniref:FAD-binding PCMH-type domain-containing protein n=1 Tax=Dioscorea zingiberensis TaxID=325984 RepID=A0A9D5C215_9LILI|nr:hypothetical protein J5N97_026023 [Dioscorea zingiberensis]
MTFILTDLSLISSSFTNHQHDSSYSSFLHCLSTTFPISYNLSQLLHTPNSSSYSSLLNSSIKNLLFSTPSTPRPLLIITPSNPSHIQASIFCCKLHNLRVRVLSGGHDYEGLSYRSSNQKPFVILDLSNLRGVKLDSEQGTAWVQSGAMLGELYYKIAHEIKSFSYGFPAGICPTVAVGGHLSGGGFVFTIHKTLSQNAVDLVNHWQDIAHRLPEDLFIRVIIQRNEMGEVEALFNSLFLGGDLDLGLNEEEDWGITSYSSARVWGMKYFKGNFERLATVKRRVDPGDFFRSEQSIPPLVLEMEGEEHGLVESS